MCKPWVFREEAGWRNIQNAVVTSMFRIESAFYFVMNTNSSSRFLGNSEEFSDYKETQRETFRNWDIALNCQRMWEYMRVEIRSQNSSKDNIMKEREIILHKEKREGMRMDLRYEGRSINFYSKQSCWRKWKMDVMLNNRKSREGSP
jgi:hypothetical protein